MTAFTLASVLGGLVVLIGMVLRGAGRFAVFVAILYSIHTAVAASLVPLLGSAEPVAWVLQALTVLHLATMKSPRLRPPAYQVLVAWPGSAFLVGTFFALPLLPALWIESGTPALLLPFLVAAGGIVWSVVPRQETVTLDLRVPAPGRRVQRHNTMLQRRPGLDAARTAGALRIVQISDPHLGPFMSVHRLSRILSRAVALEPDLIVVTGDLLTVSSQFDPDALHAALEPLRAHPRVFACLGNHDHEALPIVRSALLANGVRLLTDEEALVQTPWGPVQVVGLDFCWRDRASRLAQTLAALPRRPLGDATMFRLLLLHDPGMFRHLPDGAGDLVLSGHTHGGHVGLVSLGLDWTVVGALSGIPDHGAWARGSDRLYVHRTTGHYGFPLRVGVPAEESVLEILGARA